MDNQLERIIQLHEEQNALLKRYLWRLRFSLLGLLLLTILSAIALAFISYKLRQTPIPGVPKFYPAAPIGPPATGVYPQPTGAYSEPIPPDNGSAVRAGQTSVPIPADDPFR
jgi:hypothetical protein